MLKASTCISLPNVHLQQTSDMNLTQIEYLLPQIHKIRPHPRSLIPMAMTVFVCCAATFALSGALRRHLHLSTQLHCCRCLGSELPSALHW